MRTKMSTRSQIVPMAALVVLVVAALACNAPAAPATPAEPAPSREAVEPTAAAPPTRPPSVEPVPVSNARGPGFASYPNIPVSLPAAYDGYALPLEVAALRNYDSFTFGDAQGALLAQNGFFVAPADWLEFFQLYESARYEELPVFVTTDSVYHVYHLLFDKMLRDLEREHFEPDMRALTAACLASAQELQADLQGTQLEEMTQRVVAYFAVADHLINPDAVAPPEVADLVRE